MRRLALLALVLAGCDQPPPSAAASASASAAPPPPVTATATAATTVPAMADLDVVMLRRTLACGGDKSGACGVVAKIAGCTAWNPVVPSGDGRWLGHGWIVEGSKRTDQLTVLRARRVPTNEVGQNQLGVRISIGELGKQEGQAYEQADRVIRIFERSDSPPHASPTLDYVKQRTDWPESFAMRTDGGQVYALTQNGAYLCEGAKRTVLLVQRGSSHGTSADGLYAELWPTSW